MRAIHIAHLDKARPVLLLTRETVQPHLDTVTVAPLTGTIRGLSTEVPVGVENGLEGASVVACDHVTTIPRDALGERVGHLLDDQDVELAAAIRAAFDLD